MDPLKAWMRAGVTSLNTTFQAPPRLGLPATAEHEKAGTTWRCEIPPASVIFVNRIVGEKW